MTEKAARTQKPTRVPKPDTVYNKLRETHGTVDGITLSDSLDLVIFGHAEGILMKWYEETAEVVLGKDVVTW